MKRVLLLGGGGFLGRHIGAALAAHTALRSPSRAQCDLVRTELSEVTALIDRERPDVVVSAAGRIVGSGYDFVRAHVVTTAKLIEAMALAAPGARLIRIGSAAEYGVVPHGLAVGEDHPGAPVSEYGLSHLAATRLAELAGDAGRLDTIVLRVFNPVGPGMPAGNMLSRVTAMVGAAVAGGACDVALGLHDTYRDLVDVRDVAAAVLAATRCAPGAERVVNVGSGRAVATRDVVRLLADVAGFRGEIRHGTFPPDATRSAAVPWMCADIDRARRVLGWAPAHDLSESLRTLWRADGARSARPVAGVAAG
ncbi:NAD-dependent epimerase/dehydratase family protein [Micromonospora sp. WMMD975]|uniref:NAD-dependent epimerase/dehydratase family protein n=1 Tax=Micromonospora sp. WMMD975 TaxID=3016087 RepID=UPI00249BF69F|nr:NAD-dependent epimerase/dehydratase family protein [Micromonospora sp. WMMD975]WFE34832.1 NAD-dependent epimerase/dehydratase family protein [Micromonospora sp. WMMD975]